MRTRCASFILLVLFAILRDVALVQAQPTLTESSSGSAQQDSLPITPTVPLTAAAQDHFIDRDHQPDDGSTGEWALQRGSSMLNKAAAGGGERNTMDAGTDAPPFISLFNVLNGSWIKFFIIALISSRVARVFPKFPLFPLPLITGYMVIGCVCGPYLVGLISKSQLSDLGFVTRAALAFISYSAGSELYVPELRSLLKTILLVTGLSALSSYVLCSLFIYSMAAGGLIGMEWMQPYLGSCAWSISLVGGSIMVARSPASAIAVVREVRAKGPATSIMLGVTVVGDVVVLVLFALSNSFVLAMCGSGGFDGGAFFVTLLTLALAVAIGYGQGLLLNFLLWIPKVPAKLTILPIGFVTFTFCDWLAEWTEEHWGFALNFDALLICITAGYVVTNHSPNRIVFVRLLHSCDPFIFVPFFTLVGAQLDLGMLGQSLLFGFLVFVCRGLSIMIGCSFACYLAGLKHVVRTNLWMSMLAQAGVSLGLSSEVGVKFPAWGAHFHTQMVSVILINQFVGPVLCKVALKKMGEAGKGKIRDVDGHDEEDDEEEEDEYDGPDSDQIELRDIHHTDASTKQDRPRALFIGVDSRTLSSAAKLLKAGWCVTLMDAEESKLLLAVSLGISACETRSNFVGDEHHRRMDASGSNNNDSSMSLPPLSPSLSPSPSSSSSPSDVEVDMNEFHMRTRSSISVTAAAASSANDEFEGSALISNSSSSTMIVDSMGHHHHHHHDRMNAALHQDFHITNQPRLELSLLTPHPTDSSPPSSISCSSVLNTLESTYHGASVCLVNNSSFHSRAPTFDAVFVFTSSDEINFETGLILSSHGTNGSSVSNLSSIQPNRTRIFVLAHDPTWMNACTSVGLVPVSVTSSADHDSSHIHDHAPHSSNSLPMSVHDAIHALINSANGSTSIESLMSVHSIISPSMNIPYPSPSHSPTLPPSEAFEAIAKRIRKLYLPTNVHQQVDLLIAKVSSDVSRHGRSSNDGSS